MANKTNKHPKVMLVEDEPDTRRLLEHLLKPFCFRLHSFQLGGEALEYFLKNPDFDFIILDLYVPQVNGLEIAYALRRARPNIPILFLTGYPDSPMMPEIRNMGNLQIIAKPFKNEEFTQAVQTMTNHDGKIP